MQDTFWKNFLTNTLSQPEAHYLWLRSLSYLEYIGYRKMVKALDHHQVSREVFHHLTDEIRHSYMLKELADKILKQSGEGEASLQSVHDNFAPGFIDIAEAYFQDLDAQVKTWVEGKIQQEAPFLCYLMTSYLIEIRAMNVYPSYHGELSDAGEKTVIKQIIKDEREHLDYLQAQVAQLPYGLDLDQEELKDFEEKRFDAYLKDFEEQRQSIPIALSA